jgi:RNA polymerase sigma factor (sigma-70 family)
VILLVSGEESPEQRVRRLELAALLVSAIDVLTPRQRRLITLRYVADATFSRIAAEFGTGEPAVHAMHARALVRLRSALAARNIQFAHEVY